jgi:hypothetical protein
MTAQIPISGPGVIPPALPDGVINRTRKRKQAFTLNDPDNVELQRLATQAAKKKAKQKKVASSDKPKTHTSTSKPIEVPQLNRQPSIEEVVDTDDDEKRYQRIFPRNPKHVIESDSDEDGVNVTTRGQPAKKKTKLSQLPSAPKKKTQLKAVPAKSNSQQATEDEDDPMDIVETDDAGADTEEAGEEEPESDVEKPAESVEAELGKSFQK